MSVPAQPLRIVLLSTGLAVGGAEMQVAELAIELRRRGHAVRVVSMLPPAAFTGALESAGIPVSSLGMRPGRPGLMAFLRFLDLLRRERPCVLHAHLFHANLLARLARLIAPVPVVISTIHSLAESRRASAKVRLRDCLYRLTDALGARTVSVSRAVAARHLASRAVSTHRSLVIPNGARPEVFKAVPEDRARLRESLGLGEGFVWLAAGRLMWKKDYATMLLAMARRPGGTLLIAGEGPLEPELRAQAGALNLPVCFLGLRGDIPQLMNAADGFVLSSVVEGLPMVLIEAAFAGLPAVAADAGGVREVVLDGESGFVAPPGDPAALASAMGRLAAMPVEARRAMGRAARQNAIRRFSISEVAAQWESLYRECLLESEQRLLP